jgi:pSer/pThr/pTyr-binding forkhead associated (FHA) protein
MLVGRDAACDLVLADPRASRRHAEVVREGAAWRVRDLGSSNGTFLNGAAVTEAELGLGDVLTIGDSELVVEPGGGA